MPIVCSIPKKDSSKIFVEITNVEPKRNLTLAIEIYTKTAYTASKFKCVQQAWENHGVPVAI